MPGKARVHELAKEFGVDSKTVLAKLKEQGEFVKSASSTVEAPVARRIREAFASAGNGGGSDSGAAAPARPGARRPGPAAAPAAPVQQPAAPRPGAPRPAAPREGGIGAPHSGVPARGGATPGLRPGAASPGRQRPGGGRSAPRPRPRFLLGECRGAGRDGRVTASPARGNDQEKFNVGSAPGRSACRQDPSDDSAVKFSR